MPYLHGAEVIEISDGIRPIRTVNTSVIGLVGTAPAALPADFPADTPVLISGPRAAAALGETGTLREAYDAIYAQGVGVAVVVRVEEGADAAATLAAVAGNVANQTGVFALTLAKAQLGVAPRILAAPGFTHPADAGVANPVAVNLISLTERMRAVAVVDGPNTTEANAVSYASELSGDRTFLVDPFVRVFDDTSSQYVARPSSGYVAGVIARTDNDRGFWWSPSNQSINGIVGTARPVSFGISDPDTEAGRLNEAKVTTVVNEGGYRVWGNRTLATDPLWTFLPVRRTADAIYDSIERGHLWAIDRPFSTQLLLDIRDSVQSYLDQLTALGALLGGSCYLDPELNTEATLKAGQLYLDFDIEPPGPLERLTFRAHRNGDYYDELVADVARAS